MLKQLRKRTEGFTIIEVMIVLAIAGLILLIVFLAVPALQRNSRNTQSKSDAAAFLGAAQEWSNNNNGNSPADGLSSTAGSNAEAIKQLAKTKNLDFLEIVTKGAGAAEAPDDLNQVVLIKNARCGRGQVTISGASPNKTVANVAAGGDGVVTGTSSRQWVIVYSIENSSAGQLGQCTES